MDESCNLTSDRADHLIISSLEKEQNAKAASGVSMQPEGVRCIKYTFNRRKRKNVSLNSSSLVSLADKQESQAKPETQNHLVESPKGDNQLAHVAQQVCYFIFCVLHVHLRCIICIQVFDKLILFCSSFCCQSWSGKNFAMHKPERPDGFSAMMVKRYASISDAIDSSTDEKLHLVASSSSSSRAVKKSGS